MEGPRKRLVTRYINELPGTYSVRQPRYVVATVEDSLEYPGNKTQRGCGHYHWYRGEAETCWMREYGMIECPHVQAGEPVFKKAATTTGKLGLFCLACFEDSLPTGRA